MRHLATAGLICVFALAACGTEPPRSVASDTYHVTPAGEIGGGEGEGALTDVFGVAVSPDGHVFVSEPPLARVVEFDEQGGFVRVVGGRGRGPGEFQVPGGLFWRGDTLAVADFISGISLFAPDGSFQQRIAFIVNVPGTPFGGRPILPLPDGSIGVDVPPATSGAEAGPEVWLKASRTGSVLDTLVFLPGRGRGFSLEAHGRARTGTHPLAWAPLLATPPSGTHFVIVEREPAQAAGTASFRLLRVDLEGDTVATRDIEYVPSPVPDEAVDSISAAMAGRMANQFEVSPEALAESIEDQLEWPSYEPPVSSLLVGSDGTVWIRREALGVASVGWEILDEGFGSIGRLRLPASLEPKVVSRHALWAVEKDSLDVPHVLRFDVVEGG